MSPFEIYFFVAVQVGLWQKNRLFHQQNMKISNFCLKESIRLRDRRNLFIGKCISFYTEESSSAVPRKQDFDSYAECS